VVAVAGKGKKMVKPGKGKSTFASNSSTSNSAPRAPGPAGKGGNWRAGIAQHGEASSTLGMASRPSSKSHIGTPAVQGSSTANMGDNCSTRGHNAPRGFYAKNAAKKGILAGGSTPLAKTGTRNPAAQVTGPYGF